ncbi:MAG: VWA domain-containing protein [Gammaproteobacteria bacterium]|nr:VWA domain-containing protein [Gammaproteobacteria bacterium]
MNAQAATILRTLDYAIVPLQRVSATGRLDGLIFELTVEQHYRNTSATTLETVFTFPLPLHAVLLGFELDLNGKLHQATAFPRAQAETRYEHAIDSGDSAALLTDNGNGLYTVSIGNLQPGDAAVIRYRYAELLSAHDDYVRLAIPTVIAPRYGDPAAANIQGPAIPGADLLAEYPFDLRIELVGLSEPAAVRSPSHALKIEPCESGLTVRLARRGFLDRDCTLELRHAFLPHEALVARDGEGCVVLASAAVPRRDAEHRALKLKVLLDCSGSMQGSSIEAARRALQALLARLHATDRLSLTRFGSTVEHLTEGLEPADPATLEPLDLLVRRIQADLGGTEMAQALTATLALTTSSIGPVDLVLITDGEIHDLEGVLRAVAEAHHRLFVIAIGAAPNEALARRLSEETGGACEFVAPGEDVAGAILRTFDRLRATPMTLSAIDWSAAPVWSTDHASAAFSGDTLHRFAGFATPPAGPITFSLTGPERAPSSFSLPIASRMRSTDVLPRLAAARRLPSMPDKDAEALAVRYQLVSPHTSFVLVAERADKAAGLPDTIAVRHMLAAGACLPLSAAVHCVSLDAPPMSLRESFAEYPASACMAPVPHAALKTGRPARRRRGTPVDLAPLDSTGQPDHGDVAALIASLAAAHVQGRPLPATLSDLCTEHPMPARLAERLKALLDTDGARYETTIVRTFIAVLAATFGDCEGATDLLDEVGQLLRKSSCRDLRRRIRQEVLA